MEMPESGVCGVRFFGEQKPLLLASDTAVVEDEDTDGLLMRLRLEKG